MRNPAFTLAYHLGLKYVVDRFQGGARLRAVAFNLAPQDARSLEIEPASRSGVAVLSWLG